MRLGIQKKLAFTISTFLLVFLAVSSWAILRYTTKLTLDNIKEQQFAMTKIIAGSIDDKLGSWLAIIADNARTTPVEIFKDRRTAQHFLEDRSGIRSIFTNGIMLYDKNLELIAESPIITDRKGFEADVIAPFLRSVDSNGLPDISHPYISPQTKAPAIVMAATISDSDDRTIGFLVGSINLTKDYFIEELTSFKIGDKGYLYLISNERVLIVHPDRERILKLNDVPRGANRLLDEALLGFEGSGETINTRGMKQLASFKRLRTVDWVLGCVFPREEAYAPIIKMRSYMISVSVATILLSILLTWIVTSRMTYNLNYFTRQVALLKDLDGPNAAISIKSNDEVGQLAESYNSLITRLTAKENDLVSHRDALEKRTIELEKAMQQVKSLSGILPICAWCKKIRNDTGYWDQLESYICEHSDADFTHSICPECYEQMVKDSETGE
ncbi:MAG: cache domain-containing protein [Desulfuromonadaceae bacterium]|nr:cache domain-containing protein [Desulfuromonadaceae bacterium]MDD5106980.1 cache domain-containing protein [Desulfuromonadaceae bacterium]